jgi:hypothetical protein
MDDKIKKLMEWVTKNYSPRKCGYTSLRSQGNCDDCFNDGVDSGNAYAAYVVGTILGMELEEPDEPDFDE